MVNFNYFRTLDPETADLARELIDANINQRSEFSSFVNLWMGFNGWMECVTDANTDAEMITALVSHQRLSDAYDDLMKHCPDFQEKVEIFATMWPVLNVRDVRRKLGRDAFWRFSREELMAEVVRENVKLQPITWSAGDVPTWPHLLRTVYAVRCNLFHGSKSPQNYRDHELVVSCDKILRMFIDHTGCFEWRD
ncbi:MULTISPECIES: hypothetical protein [Pseudomonas]|uniref:Apea-like HEPN domain-containing protein n=1 Tax=Pseudomonas wuhanensis TaxID=2954098 RepID=A0ABY9GK63_9PSED|nr:MULTISPECIES: hypothetical protein [unclassified Pseudomonas]WLI10347.1 hypothetical protein PSH65_18960 [Pseudomonas sp. FP603]WLI16158.1 hypothetical protein PSH88_17585 [Pseudomonas sp. FP607]